VDPPEAAVGVLRNAHRLCEPGGLLLHLTCVPPPAAIEVDGRLLGRLDESAFLDRVARTEEAVELLIAEGLLVDEASLAHDVLKHYGTGAAAIADIDERPFIRIPAPLRKELTDVAGPVVERTACLLRRLRVLPG